MLNLIQQHTINIYNLESKQYIREVVSARDLLDVTRFDLFAKLYYARNRKENREKALDVYIQHIKAFNPDLKEPGRDDKVTLTSFVDTFDHLLDYFQDNDFDDSISLIPVDDEEVILDGAHRVAALAFYDKNVTILRFKDVHSKGPFDYKYFKDRGLSWTICDLIANEIPLWKDNILAACLWPQMGDTKCKDKGTEFLSSKYKVCYTKDLSLNLKTIQPLISQVYAGQPWVNSKEAIQNKSIWCYGHTNHILRIVLLESNLSLEETISNKEKLRDMFNSGKHSVHITDSVEETRSFSKLVFTEEGLALWNKETSTQKLLDNVRERWFYFKKVEWINFKVAIARIIKR